MNRAPTIKSRLPQEDRILRGGNRFFVGAGFVGAGFVGAGFVGAGFVGAQFIAR